VYIRFWSENLKGRDHSADLRHRQEDTIKMDLKEIRCQYVD
jgi:hypothetical protein